MNIGCPICGKEYFRCKHGPSPRGRKFVRHIKEILEYSSQDDWKLILKENKDWRKRLMIDFDGVIHKVKEGAAHNEVSGEPMEESVVSIKRLVKNWQVVIFTARSPKLFPLIRKWLKIHGFPHLYITNRKLVSMQLFDDRATRFVSWHDVTHYY